MQLPCHTPLDQQPFLSCHTAERLWTVCWQIPQLCPSGSRRTQWCSCPGYKKENIYMMSKLSPAPTIKNITRLSCLQTAIMTNRLCACATDLLQFQENIYTTCIVSWILKCSIANWGTSVSVILTQVILIDKITYSLSFYTHTAPQHPCLQCCLDIPNREKQTKWKSTVGWQSCLPPSWYLNYLLLNHMIRKPKSFPMAGLKTEGHQSQKTFF